MHNLFLVLLLAGCASQQRDIASFSGSSLPGATGLFKKDYQGPFSLNPENATRKPALVYLPTQYEKEKSWPLVILLHGYTGTAETEDKYLTLRNRVSSRGFILLTPEGTANSEKKQFWNATDFCCDFEKTGVDDVGYLSALIEKVEKEYRVDKSRIYLFGHSNGGFMANRMVCEFEGRFAAVASLAGGTFKNPANCKVQEPVPYLQIHAVDDATVKYEGTDLYAGGLETVEQRRQMNGCEASFTEQESLDLVLSVPGSETTPKTYDKGCEAEVSLWTIKAHQGRFHNPHVPLFQWGFTGRVLDFLLKQKR